MGYFISYIGIVSVICFQTLFPNLFRLLRERVLVAVPARKAELSLSHKVPSQSNPHQNDA